MVSKKEIEDWYNRRYLAKGEKIWRPSKAYSIFLDYLNVKPGGKLLDIGCGTGFLLRHAEERGLDAYGIDIAAEGVKIASEVSPNSKVTIGDGEKLKFSNNFFDYIVCIGALEHSIDMKKGLKEIRRIGKKDASFCIVVPNVHYLFWKFRHLKGTEQQDINEHLLSLKQWREMFIKERFKIIKLYQDKWLMKNISIFMTLNPLGIIKKTILKAICLFLPLNYAYQFIFILTKKLDI